jgi:hypothetical protein
MHVLSRSEPSRRGSSRSALCPRQENAPTANRSSNTQSLSVQTILYRIPLAANARRFRAELASQLAQAHAALFRWSDAVNVLENTLTALRDPRRTGAGRRGSSRRCRGRACVEGFAIKDTQYKGKVRWSGQRLGRRGGGGARVPLWRSQQRWPARAYRLRGPVQLRRFTCSSSPSPRRPS